MRLAFDTSEQHGNFPLGYTVRNYTVVTYTQAFWPDRTLVDPLLVNVATNFFKPSSPRVGRHQHSAISSRMSLIACIISPGGSKGRLSRQRTIFCTSWFPRWQIRRRLLGAWQLLEHNEISNQRLSWFQKPVAKLTQALCASSKLAVAWRPTGFMARIACRSPF